MNLQFEITDAQNSAEAKAILDGIIAYNDQYRTEDWRELTITAKDAEGKVAAGLNGSTDWGWLFVKLLWVREDARGSGLGQQLMAQAEAEARRRGSHSSWLDTFSFQARGFYEKLGYAEFGTLKDYPVGHQRFFLWKKLG